MCDDVSGGLRRLGGALGDALQPVVDHATVHPARHMDVTPAAMAAHAEWRKKHTEHLGRVRGQVDQTFGLNAAENSWAASGAALTAIKNLSEKNELIEPKMPPDVANISRSTGDSVWSNQDGGTMGMFDFVFTQKGSATNAYAITNGKNGGIVGVALANDTDDHTRNNAGKMLSAISSCL